MVNGKVLLGTLATLALSASSASSQNIQAGLTTNGDVKDRLTLSEYFWDKNMQYKGLHEAFQNESTLLDNPYSRNELHFIGLGNDHVTPITVIKFGDDDGFRLKDMKVGIRNNSLLKALLGNGRVYLTTDGREVTGFAYYENVLPGEIKMEITGEGTFGPERPFMYIEGEFQKRIHDRLFAYTRGEIDNQGKEDKIVLGLGYHLKK